jgi:hypothetical protein
MKNLLKNWKKKLFLIFEILKNIKYMVKIVFLPYFWLELHELEKQNF